MDLGAYAQIEDLESLAKENGIEVPRLRGYRLMSEETPINLKEWTDGVSFDICRRLCESNPFWDPNANCFELSSYTDCLKEFYLDEDNKTIRWDRIHGWKRKVLKTAIHNKIQQYKKQADVFNKYAGKDDILYIHARIGGGNWSYYCKDVIDKDWFIEKVDDSFDCTYCDIYARIRKQKED